MRTNNRYRENPVQDLLNAVVVQAAEDYRDYCSRLLKDPDDKEAKREREAVRRFFLSEDFKVYTTVAGSRILSRLEDEQREVKLSYQKYRDKVAAVALEARECAKLLMQWQASDDESEELLHRGQEQEKLVRNLIEELRAEKDKLPKEIRKFVRVMSYEPVMEKSYRQLEEDIRNGKENLWG